LHISQSIHKYKKSLLEDFTREMEAHFRELNTQPSTNNDHTLTHLNSIITEADKKYVQKNNR
jgi:hypothetical protein